MKPFFYSSKTLFKSKINWSCEHTKTDFEIFSLKLVFPHWTLNIKLITFFITYKSSGDRFYNIPSENSFETALTKLEKQKILKKLNVKKVKTERFPKKSHNNQNFERKKNQAYFQTPHVKKHIIFLWINLNTAIIIRTHST